MAFVDFAITLIILHKAEEGEEATVGMREQLADVVDDQSCMIEHDYVRLATKMR